MPRPVSGVLVVEGTQTGDGRVIVEGALTWADLPLPLAWIRDGDQHINLTEVAPQIGVIETITRVGLEIQFTGAIDDENVDGAEMIRRLEAGMGSHGSRQLISIDPDNWEVQIVVTQPQQADELLLVASGSGMPSFTAAAGDGDVDPASPDNEAELLFEDNVDSILERYTRLRIRGVTACSVSAFTEAWMELDGAVEAPAGSPAAPAVVAAAERVVALAVRPPASFFAIPEPDPTMRGMVEVYGMPAEELLVEQPDGGLGVPLVITDDRRVFGHLARWGQAHTGYPGQFVTAPESASAYAHFHVGEVVCDGGERVATGALVVGCDHAGERMGYAEARDHYAHSGLGWADVRATNGALGCWVSGVLRPSVTEGQLRLLRALSLSGDWRRIGGALELISGLAVNVPGFPIAREAVTAAALSSLSETAGARAHYADGDVMSLVASGVVTRCPDCQRRALAAAAGGAADREQLDLLRTIELRTRHLVPAAREAALARIRR